MGLIKETNAQYYSGQAVVEVSGSGQTDFTFNNYNTKLISAYDQNYNQVRPNSNYTMYYILTPGDAPIALDPAQSFVLDKEGTTIRQFNTYTGGLMVCELQEHAVEDNYGSYSHTSLNDVINNFLITYVGEDKLIPKVKRSDVIFHAKRGLQEFSFDTLKSKKSQELTIPPSLSVAIPQDYVNYVKVSWVDGGGVTRIIYPTTLTQNPTELPIQDTDGIPTQGSFGQNLEAAQSEIEGRWKNQSALLSQQWQNYPWGYYWGYYPSLNWYGKFYGLNPETAQANGWFTINERTGMFSFSSDLAGALVTLEYISDGLAANGDTQVPKMAEDAMYKHIIYSILAGRRNIPEYIVQRWKKDRAAALRNAKIRLSNIKLGEFTQVMRGKSKWIKH